MIKKKDTLADKFKRFVSNLSVDNQSIISKRYKDITKQINLDYWHVKSDTRNAHYIGSYGRGTAIKGVANINMLVVLPQKVFQYFDTYQGNGQLVLIQDVKETVCKIFRNANINPEGHLLVTFPDITFEVVPSFLSPKKSYIYPEPKDEGSWKVFNPIREIEVVEEYNFKYNGKIKHLAKMMRAWKATHNVPISGMLIDTLVLNFMEVWEGNETTFSYYGDMIGDFLEYLAGLRKGQLHWYAKGSNRKIPGLEDFGEKANIAFKKTMEALEHESQGDSYNANNCWKEIFGEYFPG